MGGWFIAPVKVESQRVEGEEQGTVLYSVITSQSVSRYESMTLLDTSGVSDYYVEILRQAPKKRSHFGNKIPEIPGTVLDNVVDMG